MTESAARDVSSGTAAPARVSWKSGSVPIAVVMISLNEAHNMAAVLENLKGFAHEVFLVDSYSSDETVDIALSHGVYVVQRKFKGFGDQWNFALRELPVSAPWTMKLDPDERLTGALKRSIGEIIARKDADAFNVCRRLWFMGRPLPVTQVILRGWRTGTCRFSDVLVNEYPLVEGRAADSEGDLEHHDSPNLHHWFDKQNRYSTAEALSAYKGHPLAASPRLFGSKLERRMWLKNHFSKLPMRFALLYAYNLLATGAWRAGQVGRAWARSRVEIHRAIELKLIEMRKLGHAYGPPLPNTGKAHPGALQADRLRAAGNTGDVYERSAASHEE
tara:strand:- start:1148 stop:2143 length:996 start_codon:yes stop_codon:yes gene_type:complete